MGFGEFFLQIPCLYAVNVLSLPIKKRRCSKSVSEPITERGQRLHISWGTGSIGILIKLITGTEMILLSNGGPQPRSRHVFEYGISASGNLSVGGLQRAINTQILQHRSFITSPPGFLIRGGLVWQACPFTRKVAGVVERAALEMR